MLGSLPTHAGLVWTDGAGTVSFEAFDRNGVSMGVRGPFDIADSAYFGATAEDRFLGAYNPQGISAIRVLNTSGRNGEWTICNMALATAPMLRRWSMPERIRR